MVSFVALRQTKNVAQMTARLTPEERERQDVAELVLKRALQYLESTYHPPGPPNNGAAAAAALSKELFVKRASVGEVVTLREWFERVDLKGTIRLVGQSINASSSAPSISRELAFFFFIADGSKCGISRTHARNNFVRCPVSVRRCIHLNVSPEQQ